MLENSPTDAFLQFARAQELRNAGRDQEALEGFLALRQNQPQYVGTYYHLAQLQTEAGNDDEARDAYKAGMRAAKAVGDTHAHGELEKALKVFEAERAEPKE